MKNRFIVGYGIAAILVLVFAVGWFAFSIASEIQKGAVEAEKSFSWISRTTELSSVSDGFMSDSFVKRITGVCRQSRSLAAMVITTPSGMVYAWPDGSPYLASDASGQPRITDSGLFMKTFSMNLDLPDVPGSPVLMTAVLYILHPSAIYASSRVSFLVTLALILITFIVIIAVTPARKKEQARGPSIDELDAHVSAAHVARKSNEAGIACSEQFDDSAVSMPPDRVDEGTLDGDDGFDYGLDVADSTDMNQSESECVDGHGDAETVTDGQYDIEGDRDTSPAPHTEESPAQSQKGSMPEGLYSPVTGIGWEQYLSERLDSELVRAASSEQDLSLVILRVSGLVHTDLVSRKIAQILLDVFKFRDMIFEFSTDGFAGILQNINLDQAMKVADGLFSRVDGLLMEMSFDGKITIGITTRTARLLPAERMIEEAFSAAKKAAGEPNIPIVAFRANPEKYRNFLAEKG